MDEQMNTQQSLPLQLSTDSQNTDLSALPVNTTLSASPEDQPTSQAQPADNTPSTSNKRKRVDKACDFCNERKAKCHGSQPCKECKDLNLPCTYIREMGRRGPTNKRVDDYRKIANALGLADIDISSSSSAALAAEALASSAQCLVLSVESICPFPLLKLLVDDYFMYVHPLTPVPHEPSFRAALGRRADRNEPKFIALIASMVGCLIAAFPQRLRLHFESVDTEHHLTNPIGAIEQCRKVASEARGSAFHDNDFTVYDAITSLLLGLTGVYVSDWKTCRVHLAQCQTISRILGMHEVTWPMCSDLKLLNQGMTAKRASKKRSSQEHIDLIAQELGRRTFWALFLAIKTLNQIGVSFSELFVPPQTRSEPYPPLPLELDDTDLTSTDAFFPPSGTVSRLVAFNANVQVLLSCDKLAILDDGYGVDETFGLDQRKAVLEHSLLTMRNIMNDTSNELDLGDPTAPDQPQEPLHHSNTKLFTQDLGPHPLGDYDFKETAAELARIQRSKVSAAERAKVQYRTEVSKYRIQVSNFHANQLSVCSYLVGQYWSLCEVRHSAHSPNDTTISSSPCFTSNPNNYLPDTTQSGLDEELILDCTEVTIRNFIMLLGFITQDEIISDPRLLPTFQIVRLHRITRGLLEVLVHGKGKLAHRVENYLHRFLEAFEKLECLSSASETTSPEDDEERSQQWAQVKRWSTIFMMAGESM